MTTILRFFPVATLLLLAVGSVAAGTLGVHAGSARSGSFGLAVGLSTCADPQTPIVTLPGPVVGGTAAFEACETLRADTVAVTDGDVVFRSGTSVVLGNGFAVQAGARWTAAIEPALALTAYVEDDSPSAEGSYAARFHLRLDALQLAPGDGFDHFSAYRLDGTPQLVVSVRRAGAQHFLALDVREQDGAFSTTEGGGAELLVPVGYQQVNLAWRAAEPGSANGIAELSVGGQSARLDGLDNAPAQIDFVRWGVLSGSQSSASSGWLELDDFSSAKAF